MLDAVAFLILLLVTVVAAWFVVARTFGPPRSRARAAGRAAAIIAVSIVLLGVAVWRLTNARTVQLLGTIVPRVSTVERVVALTFDDGPFGPGAQRIGGVLDSAGIRATFFLNGRDIANDLTPARDLVAAGHEMGNHTYSHAMMLGLSQRKIREEIERTDEQIRRAGFDGTIHFRSPYGKKFVALPWYLWRSGRKNIIWDVEPDTDPVIAADSALIVQHVVENVRPGSIVLLHVMGKRNAPALASVPGIVDSLQRRGYRFVTVSELLEHSGGK